MGLGEYAFLEKAIWWGMSSRVWVVTYVGGQEGTGLQIRVGGA